MTHEQFTDAYTKNLGRTRGFLLSRGIGASLADELAQAAWSKAWERRDQLRELSSVAAWVNTIAFNLLRADARKAVTLVEMDDRDEAVTSSVQEKVDAERALGALSDEDRQLMLMHVISGWTSKEIASRLELSAVAIRVRLHRAKVQLRKRFAAPGVRSAKRKRGNFRRVCGLGDAARTR